MSHEMTLAFLDLPDGDWTERIPVSEKFPRQWITTADIEIQLSDGYWLFIPIGTVWDGASIPKWLWWLMKPIDEGAIGDLIHDRLWVDKQGQFEHFNFNIYQARKFADNERLKWRRCHAPKKWLKNWITHMVIRAIGGFFYSKQLKIPT